MKKLKALGKLLSKQEMKKIIGGDDYGNVVLCGAKGDYLERCSCKGTVFYCCHLSESTCLSDNKCGETGWVCAKA